MKHSYARHLLLVLIFSAAVHCMSFWMLQTYVFLSNLYEHQVWFKFLNYEPMRRLKRNKHICLPPTPWSLISTVLDRIRICSKHFGEVFKIDDRREFILTRPIQVHIMDGFIWTSIEYHQLFLKKLHIWTVSFEQLWEYQKFE